MPRTKSKSAVRHRKVKKLAKGFKQARRTRVKTAKETLLHSGQYAYVGRRLKRRNLRTLWIIRLNAAARLNETTYGKLISGLKQAKIELDRKILSDIAVKDPNTFAKLAEISKKFNAS